MIGATFLHAETRGSLVDVTFELDPWVDLDTGDALEDLILEARAHAGAEGFHVHTDTTIPSLVVITFERC